MSMNSVSITTLSFSDNSVQCWSQGNALLNLVQVNGTSLYNESHMFDAFSPLKFCVLLDVNQHLEQVFVIYMYVLFHILK